MHIWDCRDGGNAAEQLDAACEAGLEPFKAALNDWWAAQSGGSNAEMPEWLPQLRCLVQAGVPRVRPSFVDQVHFSASAFHQTLYTDYLTDFQRVPRPLSDCQL